MTIIEILGYTEKQIYGFAFFVIIGFFGMIAHWTKMCLRDETKQTLIHYLFIVNRKYTAMSVLTYFGALAAIIAIVPDIEFASSQTLALSFTAGYMIDSAINKDTEI